MASTKKRTKKITVGRSLIYLVLVFVLGIILLSIRKIPEKIEYGVSFSKFRAEELNLDWKKTYDAILNDLGVRKFRLVAHWPMIEPKESVFSFSELDYQMNKAREKNAPVILAVGRRLPSWPECHEPEWAKNLSAEEKEKKIFRYVEAVVNRYKSYSNLKYWQVENEFFLGFFAKHHCEKEADKLLTSEDYIKREIDLVRRLDPTHPILLTDSGEFGRWYKPYQLGDIFGTSMYLYIWSHYFGPIRYPVPVSFFKIKQNLLDVFYENKPKILIELSVEPWLLEPIVDSSFSETRKVMNLERFKEIISFAKKSGFDTQYLWGAEWWYYEKINGRSDFWEEGKKLFK